MVIGGGGSARVRLARDGRESEARRSARRAETSHFIIRLLAACIPFTCAQRAARGGRGATPRTPPTRPRPIDQSVMDHRTPAGFVFHTTPDVIVTITHTQLTGHTRHMSCHIGTVARAAVFASIDEYTSSGSVKRL